MLKSPRKQTRKISKIPYKVLDAPDLQDDFYLNLVDWSSTNVLSVGLGASVYLWSAATSQVTRLVDLGLSRMRCRYISMTFMVLISPSHNGPASLNLSFATEVAYMPYNGMN